MPPLHPGREKTSASFFFRSDPVVFLVEPPPSVLEGYRPAAKRSRFLVFSGKQTSVLSYSSSPHFFSHVFHCDAELTSKENSYFISSVCPRCSPSRFFPSSGVPPPSFSPNFLHYTSSGLKRRYLFTIAAAPLLINLTSSFPLPLVFL